MTTSVLQYTVDSVSYGSLYALISLSLALLFGVMGLMNFAYGELIMAGGYTMFIPATGGGSPWSRGHPDRHGALGPDGALAFRPLRARRAGRAPDHLLRGQLRARGCWLHDVGPITQKGVEPYPWLRHSSMSAACRSRARPHHLDRHRSPAHRHDAADQSHDPRDPAARLDRGLQHGPTGRGPGQSRHLVSLRDHRHPRERGRRLCYVSRNGFGLSARWARGRCSWRSSAASSAGSAAWREPP